MNPVVRKILKIFGWIIASVILLLILVFILIQIPAVQNFAKDKAVAYLQNKLKTKVSIGNLSIDFPKQIVLKDIYLEDQNKDTLLAGKEVRIDIALLKLLSSEVNVDYIGLTGIRANIYRLKPDTTFNYQYIVDAFASNDTTQAQTKDTTSTLQFHLDHIVFNNILTTFKDDVTGNDVYFYLGNFETHIDKFEPDNLVYGINSIAVSDVNARVYQYKPFIQKVDTVGVAASPADNPSAASKLSLGSLDFKNINFNYKNDISAMLADLKLGELATHPGTINLADLSVQLKDLTLNNTTAKIVLGKTQEADKTKKVVAEEAIDQTSNPWKIVLNDVSFNNNNFSYDDNAVPKAASGMDFSHLDITSFVFKADSLTFTPDSYRGAIEQLAFNEQSGFDLQKFHANFLYSDTAAYLNNLLIQTDRSVIKDQIALSYPSVEAMSKTPGEIFLNVDLNNSQIAVKDILAFMPTFKRNARGNEDAVLKLNTEIKGYVKDLSIPQFQLSGLGNTNVNIAGSIKGLPDVKNTYYDIKIDQLKSTRSDVLTLMPPGSLPNSFRLPEVFSMEGFFKGSMNAFNTQLALRTNRGNIDVKGNMNSRKAYNADIAVNNVQVGYLMKQEQNISNVTARASVNGAGTDLRTANASFNANVVSAQVKGYTYRDLAIKGNIQNGIVQTNASINDQNIALNLDATADLNPKFPAVQLDLLLDTINLRALHFVADTLAMHGHIVADIPVTNPDSLNGRVVVNDLSVTQGARTLSADSIALVASADGEQKVINVDVANAITANLTGQYKITEIGQALQHTINQYYNLPGFKDTAFAPQNWELNAHILPEGLVLELMPDLKGSDSILIKTAYNSAANDLDLGIRSGRIIYGPQQIDSLNVTAQTAADQLNYNVSVGGVKMPSLNLYHTALSGAVANNKLDFALNLKDQKNDTRFLLAGLLNQIKNGVQLSLHPDSLILDYTKWNVGQHNFIQYDSIAGILVNNFVLSNQGQSLAINSTPQQMNAPIKVDFNNFRIGTITTIANQDSLLLDGVINGNAVVKDVTKSPVFTSDLHIDDVVYKKDTVGNLAIQVNNETANAFAANVSITGNDNDIRLNGKYYTGESRMDLKLALNQVNLGIIKPFAAGQLDDISGYLRGNINLAGTLDKPDINGDINFDSAKIVPNITGEALRLSNEKINIDNRGVHFNEFTMLDSANNKAIIDGDILTSDFKNYTFNVDLNADNFRLVNTPKKTDQLFYGKLNIDTDVKMRGTMDAPSINANLRINKATDFAFILPSSDPEVVSREGVVRFVDDGHPIVSDSVQNAIDSIAANSPLKGLDVTANIETDSAALFTVVIDERSGDALTAQGVADLSGGIDKSGKVSLTGNYMLTSGSYQLSLNFLQRKFLIQNGSTLTFTGDPTSANIDITAVYETNTPSIDLVEPAIAGRPQSEINRYKEKLPFQVLLKMQGELMKPDISFDVVLPADELSQWPEVDARLQQIRSDQSELNKQVFALLLLNRFVGENPLKSEAEGSGVAGAVRESASRILTDQLNQLAGNLVQGVDLNFDLQSERDYSTGAAENRTDLNVGVSKKLLNDRLRVNVGSNFELEGPSNSKRSASNIAGDVSVDYQLSKDGRYMLRAYRKNEYEGVVEGQVIETGVSFILTYDYNKLKELFEGRKEKKKSRVKKRNSDTNNSSNNSTNSK